MQNVIVILMGTDIILKTSISKEFVSMMACSKRSFS